MMAGPFRENCRFGLICIDITVRKDISRYCLRLFPITSTQGALKASRGKSFQSRRWKGWGREGGKLCMRGVTWVTWCVWGVRPWGMFTSSSDRRDTVLDTILETHPTIQSYSIGYTIPCFPLLSCTFFHHSLAGHCTGHYSGDTLSHTILYYPITYTNPSSFAEHYVMILGTCKTIPFVNQEDLWWGWFGSMHY